MGEEAVKKEGWQKFKHDTVVQQYAAMLQMISGYPNISSLKSQPLPHPCVVSFFPTPFSSWNSHAAAYTRV